MRKLAGVTLVELLIVMTIAGVLASLALPSFRAMLVRRAATSAATDLASDFRLARSEAIKRSTYATACRSTDSASCAGAGDWRAGWIVFTDVNNNQTVDAGDSVIRVQAGLSMVTSMGRIGDAASTRSAFTFQPTGLALNASESFLVTADSSLAGGTRLVCVSALGRMRVSAEGVAATC